jgi:hypothetical protein
MLMNIVRRFSRVIQILGVILNMIFYSAVTAQQSKLIKVIDSHTNARIPYANIVFGDSNNGTFTNKEGIAKLNPQIKSIQVSCVGYEKISFDLSQSISLDTLIIKLKEIPYQLDMVIVSAKKLKTYTLGYKTLPFLLNRETNATGLSVNRIGGAVAKKINFEKQSAKIKLSKISFYVFENPFDSTLFRFSLFEINENGGLNESKSIKLGDIVFKQKKGWVDLVFDKKLLEVPDAFYLVCENVFIKESDYLQGAPLPSYLFDSGKNSSDDVYLSNISLQSWIKSDYEVVYRIEYTRD